MKTRNGLFADVPENLWNDWHWQVANRAETVEDLKKYMTLTPDEEEGVRKTLGKLRMAVTPVASLHSRFSFTISCCFGVGQRLGSHTGPPALKEVV